MDLFTNKSEDYCNKFVIIPLPTIKFLNNIVDKSFVVNKWLVKQYRRG